MKLKDIDTTKLAEEIFIYGLEELNNDFINEWRRGQISETEMLNNIESVIIHYLDGV